jgi:glycyl-tRNA synthetase
MKMENIKLRDHDKEELSHYSNATTDFEYKVPFGWGELWGIADRTDYDLKQHQEHSGQDMSYMDPETNEKYVPYCIEPSLGVDRMTLAFLCDAYDEEILKDANGKEDKRIVLRFHPALAPFKAAVLPLTKKQHESATAIYEDLAKYFMVDYDLPGSIGKRYRRQDETGTPFCITVDFDTETDRSVTIRDRDTMEQIRLPITKIREYIEEKLIF